MLLNLAQAAVNVTYFARCAGKCTHVASSCVCRFIPCTYFSASIAQLASWQLEECNLKCCCNNLQGKNTAWFIDE